ncbi:MAG: hypothetical protein JOY99_04275 [Sphingomonadaceae bacterium]|nr:hypothetical protein [Sphingomonadaceae bacterium]
MESSALRKRAAWLHSVATRLPSRDVAQMLDRYADEMLDEAKRLQTFERWPQRSRMAH